VLAHKKKKERRYGLAITSDDGIHHHHGSHVNSMIRGMTFLKKEY
jgi:hypothetical protein